MLYKHCMVRLQCFKVGLDREKCLRTCLRLWPRGFESHVCYKHESCSVCFVRNPPKCVCKLTAYKLLRSLIHVSSNAGSNVSLFERLHTPTFVISQRHCFPLYFVYMLDSNAANTVLCFMALSSISMSVSQSSCLRYLLCASFKFPTPVSCVQWGRNMYVTLSRNDDFSLWVLLGKLSKKLSTFFFFFLQYSWKSVLNQAQTLIW